ncbi:MAG: hypothetical protein ACHQY1_01990 [Myxococcota bacterium]|jgi:hypothetical protein
MKIVRSPRPTSNYLVVQNGVLQDGRISFRALGLLMEILSRPDHWRLDSDSLAANRKEGRDAVRTAAEGADHQCIRGVQSHVP